MKTTTSRDISVFVGLIGSFRTIGQLEVDIRRCWTYCAARGKGSSGRYVVHLSPFPLD